MESDEHGVSGMRDFKVLQGKWEWSIAHMLDCVLREVSERWSVVEYYYMC